VLLTGWLSCSAATARRRLATWGAYTSYNQNGRYYTLPEIADFDDNGLWRYQGVFFSKHGNLKQTLVHLVIHSEQGLSGAELGAILGLEPRSFLSHFRNHPEIFRENRMGRWIWFAADSQILKQQQEARETKMAQGSRMPTDTEAVLILVDLLKHPNSRLEQVVRRLKPEGLHLDADDIRQLLSHHGIEKKTADFPSYDV
jgi:hypothetical protein